MEPFEFDEEQNSTQRRQDAKKVGSPVFNGKTILNHKVHKDYEGKTPIK